MKLRLWGDSNRMTEAALKKLAKRIRRNGGFPIEEPIEFVEVTEKEIQTAAEKQMKRRD